MTMAEGTMLLERLADLAEQYYEEFLESLAGFRNLLVHMYAKLDKRLEEEAFNDMEAKTPLLLREMRAAARGDPCLEDVAKPLRELGRELGLRYIVVFGSLARRGCGRDVDVAVKLGRRPRSLLEVGRLQAALEDKLRINVDLVVLDLEVSPTLAKTIVDEGILVYGDQEEYREDMLKLYKLFLDKASTPHSWTYRGAV